MLPEDETSATIAVAATAAAFLHSPPLPPHRDNCDATSTCFRHRATLPPRTSSTLHNQLLKLRSWSSVYACAHPASSSSSSSSSPSINYTSAPAPVPSSAASSPPSSLPPGSSPAVVFVLGGPGSGKGTQCRLLCSEFGFVQLCVGDLLRREAATKSALGETISGVMQRGGIVPGDVTMGLLNRELQVLSSSSSSTQIVLIDGFPRAMDQALHFERAVTLPRFVLFFDCPPAEMTRRLRARAKSSSRADDVEHVFGKRLATYNELTVPVVEHYRSSSLLKAVDAGGDKSVEQVNEDTRGHFVELLTQLETESSVSE